MWNPVRQNILQAKAISRNINDDFHEYEIDKFLNVSIVHHIY